MRRPSALRHALQVVREVSENGKALARFIDYAVQKPEVRFVTYSDLIRWMQVCVCVCVYGGGRGVVREASGKCLFEATTVCASCLGMRLASGV